MNGPGQIWGEVADRWEGLVAQVSEDQWTNATPCSAWNVQELVEHAQGAQAQGGAALGAQCEPGQPWGEVKSAVGGLLADPSQLEGTVESFGGMPKHQVAGLMTSDLLIHSWDLARAIGADETLPADAVQGALLGLQRMPDEQLRSNGNFAPAIEIADDASDQDKLIALTGRQP